MDEEGDILLTDHSKRKISIQRNPNMKVPTLSENTGIADYQCCASSFVAHAQQHTDHLSINDSFIDYDQMQCNRVGVALRSINLADVIIGKKTSWGTNQQEPRPRRQIARHSKWSQAPFYYPCTVKWPVGAPGNLRTLISRSFCQMHPTDGSCRSLSKAIS